MSISTTAAIEYVGISVTAALSAFIRESINEIAIWLLVVMWVVFADLCMGLFKAYKRKERIRPSRGLRDTMGKCAAYFAFVVASIFMEQAFECSELGKYACGLIIFGEGISIVGNFLKAHGYSLNTIKVFDFGTRKLGMGEGFVTKDDDEDEKTDLH